jgi:hypothetical protein
MDPAIISVEEIRPVWDAPCVRCVQLALLPLGWTQAPAVLPGLRNHVDSVLHLVLNACRERWH